ncbi:Epsin-3, clathrin recruitment and traffic between the Golgi and endosome [Bachmanniomyces sp. S44760]|nr:Epsin-3, clathrin recruitment and traffic between the Golgi and endosome [Bachmanniomyces sp. S44760]
MDFNSLKDQVSNLSLYDIKAGVRKVQNVVMNFTEMESKVREATNNEPWGASSTLMQEIANATYNHQLLDEIMPMIYKRFTEKAAEEWRQIYKALQLLEFLIKNGSERVIDDARSRLSLLKMLRQFHFIDQNGKNQGINVRNRAKELADLLSDVDRIRQERKKARTNRNKFGGVEGGMGGLSSNSSSRYGGFGSEDAGGYGGYSGGVYGDGGGYGGNTGGFQDSSSAKRDRFEEYDEYDDAGPNSPAPRKAAAAATSLKRETKKPEAPKKKEPEIDILSFDDDQPPAIPPKTPSNGKGPMSNVLGDLSGNGTVDDDEFDDFQTATPATQTSSRSSIPNRPGPPSTTSFASSTQFVAPKPVSATQNANLSDLVGFSSISPAPSNPTSTSTPASAFTSPPRTNQAQQMKTPMRPTPTNYQPTQPNYFTSVQAPSSTSSTPSVVGSKPPLTSNASFSNASTTPSAVSGGDAFGSLWSSASAGAGIKKTSTPSGQGPNLASMAKEKASAGIWGVNAPASSNLGMGSAPRQQSQPSSGGQQVGGGLDDLLG